MLNRKNLARHDRDICGSASASSGSERTDTILGQFSPFRAHWEKLFLAFGECFNGHLAIEGVELGRWEVIWIDLWW